MGASLVRAVPHGDRGAFTWAGVAASPAGCGYWCLAAGVLCLMFQARPSQLLPQQFIESATRALVPCSAIGGRTPRRGGA
jgi:hypothetical protein